MSAHAATAVRRTGPGAVWFPVCNQGCAMPRANSKEHATWLAREHELTSGIEEAARLAEHTCQPDYDPATLEYGPARACARCILDQLGGAA